MEERTRGQATNQLLFDICNGRITSSRFGQVLHRHESTPSECLVSEIIGYTQSVPSTPAIRWGRNNEYHARKAYLDYMQAKGHDISTETADCTCTHKPPFWEPVQMESSWILVWKTAAWAAWRSNDLSVLVALQPSIKLQLNLPKIPHFTWSVWAVATCS